MPHNAPLPPITPAFVNGVRATTATAADSAAKRFIEKLFARGDKYVTSFFERLRNALNKNKPVEGILLGIEKKLLSDSCREYAESEVKRLEEKEKHQELEMWEESALDLLSRHTPTLEQQKQLNRRGALGLGVQLLALPLTAAFMRLEWAADEEIRKEDIKKYGEKDGARSDISNIYHKTIGQGKGLLRGFLVLVAGEAIKPDGPPSSVAWRSRGWELMEGLNKILVPLQAIQEQDQAKENNPIQTIAPDGQAITDC